MPLYRPSDYGMGYLPYYKGGDVEVRVRCFGFRLRHLICSKLLLCFFTSKKFKVE